MDGLDDDEARVQQADQIQNPVQRSFSRLVTTVAILGGRVTAAILLTLASAILGLFSTLDTFDGGGNASRPPPQNSTTTTSSVSSSVSTTTTPSYEVVDYDGDGRADFVVFDQWGPEQIDRVDNKGPIYTALATLGAAIIASIAALLTARRKSDMTKLEDRVAKIEKRTGRPDGT